MMQTETEELEIQLIAADAQAAIDALLAFGGHSHGGVLAFASFPAACLVAEETHNYFAVRRRAERLGSVDGALFESFGRALKKVRARIKLLDDTDTGPENLLSFMEFVRARSPVLFAHPTSRLLQAISRPLRPDVGAFFVGESLVATSHTVLPTLGFTPEVVRDAGPGEFRKLGQYASDFSVALGEFFAQLGRVLGAHGRGLDLRPTRRALEVIATHNDFVGTRFYRHAARALGVALPNAVPSLTVCLAQANQALHLLPKLLPPESNLLRRVQYLTAFHGSVALRASVRSVPVWLEPHTGDVLALRPLRNLMAHYELRAAAKFADGSAEPFCAAVGGLAGVSVDEVSAAARERLTQISEFLGSGLTKTALRPIRALLGDHS